MANRCFLLCCRRLCGVWVKALLTSQYSVPRYTRMLLPSTHLQKNLIPSLPNHSKQFSTIVETGEELDPSNWEDEELTQEDWLRLKSEWKKDERHGYMDFSSHLLFIVKTCMKYSKDRRGKSVLDHARREMGSLPQMLFDLYCRICSGSNDQEGVRWCLNAIRKEPSLLDRGNIRSLMSRICQREDWRTDALDLLGMMRKGDIEQSAGIMEPLIVVASKNEDVDLVTRLLDEMESNNLIPTNTACLSIFLNLLSNFEEESTNLQCQEAVFKLLDYFRSKRHFISKPAASALSVWFTSIQGAPWKYSFTRVSNSGKCKTCGHELEKMTLASAEFETLKKQVTGKVIFGADIFQKTRPDEFEAFTQFVKEGGPYDIVVDGLNVAHLLRGTQPSQMLKQVIVYLVQVCRYKVLVLGRHHMNTSWPPRHMNAVRDLADCFFTENISQDDPFMLYATLHSGPKCMYMTRDLLRDHKALLDPAVHLGFIKWQKTHQMHPVNFIDNKLICKVIRKFDTVVQSTPDAWHIPFDDEDTPRFSYHVPVDWLCVTKR